LTEDNTEEPL